ncbi:MAG: hypothetical protein RJA49_3104 [Actinomycetota bacterium]|jgi:hypothetical protein
MTALEEPRTAGKPVVKRSAIGEHTIGALVRFTQRDRRDDEGNVVKKDNGKARQEMVVHVIVMPGHTAPAAIGGHTAVPEAGDEVRLILSGGAFADWIEAKAALPKGREAAAGGLETGDVIEMTTTRAQAYSGRTTKVGGELTTQAQVDAVPRGQTVGIYGPLTIRRARPDEAKWVAAADAAHHEATSTATALDDEEPF